MDVSAERPGIGVGDDSDDHDDHDDDAVRVNKKQEGEHGGDGAGGGVNLLTLDAAAWDDTELLQAFERAAAVRDGDDDGYLEENGMDNAFDDGLSGCRGDEHVEGARGGEHSYDGISEMSRRREAASPDVQRVLDEWYAAGFLAGQQFQRTLLSCEGANGPTQMKEI